MKEENLNGSVTPPVNSQENTVPAPVAPEAPAAPVTLEPQAIPTPAPAPAPAVVPEAPVVSEVPVQPEISPAPAPVAPAPVPEAAPVSAPIPEAPVAPAPVEPTPVPTPAPAPVAPAPVAPVTPAPVSAPVPEAPAPAAQPVAPTPDMGATIQQPGFTGVNPVAQPTEVPQTSLGVQPTIAPTAPLTGDGNVAFVSTGEPVKKKMSKGLLIGIIVGAVAILAVLGYFVIYPMIAKSLVKPKAVYSNTITGITKNINNTINTVLKDKFIYTVDFGIDSNIETFEEFGGYTYTGKFGIDPNNKLLEIGFGLKDSYENAYSSYVYVKNDNLYNRVSTEESLLNSGSAPEEINQIFEMFTQETTALNNEDATYVVNKISDMLIGSIDEKKLSKEDTKITVNGKSINVINSKYVIDKATYIKTMKYILEELKKDDKFLEIIVTAEEVDLTEDEIKDYIDEMKTDLEDGIEYYSKDVEEITEFDDTVLTINIYTEGANDFVGVEFNVKEDSSEGKLQYFTKDGSFNVFVYSKYTYGEEASESRFYIDGVKSGDTTNVTFKAKDNDNKETKYATLKIKEVKNGKSIDYELSEELFGGDTISGNVTYTTEETKEKMINTLDFEVKSKDDYFKINVDLTIDWTSDVANINDKDAKTVTEDELEVIMDDFMNKVESETPVGSIVDIFDSLSMMVAPSYGYDDMYSDDYGDYDDYDDYDDYSDYDDLDDYSDLDDDSYNFG